MTIIERINNGISRLPTLPTVFSAISDALADPRVTNDEIAKIISGDQASSFKVLKVANSAFYGFRSRIDTISQAIMILGFNEIRNIVLALSIINLFSKEKKLLNFRPVEFWAHSIGVGIITRAIGKETGLTNLENYFISGILHDIGKLFFYIYAGKEYAEVLRLVEEQNLSLSKAELQVFGVDHCMVGSAVAEKWRLSPNIVHAIKYHQLGPITGKYEKLVSTVHIADVFAKMIELGHSGDDIIYEPNLKAWDILNLPDDVFYKLSKIIMADYEKMVSLLLSE